MIKSFCRSTALGLAVLALSACASMNPFAAAKTPEQVAFATYGTFQIAEAEAASIIQDPTVDRNIKGVIKALDAATKPIADNTLDTALAVKRIRRALKAPQLTAEDEAQLGRDLDAVLITLATVQPKFKAKLQSFQSEIDKVK